MPSYSTSVEYSCWEALSDEEGWDGTSGFLVWSKMGSLASVGDSCVGHLEFSGGERRLGKFGDECALYFYLDLFGVYSELS
jgi:hypothetical protein